MLVEWINGLTSPRTSPEMENSTDNQTAHYVIWTNEVDPLVQGLYCLPRILTAIKALKQGSQRGTGLKGLGSSRSADQQVIALWSLSCSWTNSSIGSGCVPTAGLLAPLFPNPGLTRWASLRQAGRLSFKWAKWLFTEGLILITQCETPFKVQNDSGTSVKCYTKQTWVFKIKGGFHSCEKGSASCMKTGVHRSPQGLCPQQEKLRVDWAWGGRQAQLPITQRHKAAISARRLYFMCRLLSLILQWSPNCQWLFLWTRGSAKCVRPAFFQGRHIPLHISQRFLQTQILSYAGHQILAWGTLVRSAMHTAEYEYIYIWI